MDVWDEVDAERKELISFLEGLDEAQWDAQTLCTEWKVRDVVGHVVGATEVSIGRMLGGMVRSGFNLNKFLARDGIQRGRASSAELLDALRAVVGNRKHPPGTKPVTMLTDTLTHHQDIRRPLGLPREIPFDRLVPAADYVKALGFPIGTKKRVAGLRLTATDGEWSHGDGPEVTGSLEALLMTMMGRTAALGDLGGEGKETLAARS